MKRYPLQQDKPVQWKSLVVTAWDEDRGLLVQINRGKELSLIRWLGSFEEQGLDSPISQKELDTLLADAVESLRQTYGPGFRTDEGTIVFSAEESGQP